MNSDQLRDSYKAMTASQQGMAEKGFRDQGISLREIGAWLQGDDLTPAAIPFVEAAVRNDMAFYAAGDTGEHKVKFVIRGAAKPVPLGTRAPAVARGRTYVPGVVSGQCRVTDAAKRASEMPTREQIARQRIIEEQEARTEEARKKNGITQLLGNFARQT